MPGIFDGIRVVECASGVAGPLAGLLLAEYGAEVVKVEPPGGHPERGEPAFHYYSRSKHAIALDDRDRVGLAALLEGADVLLVDGPPARRAASGLDYATVAAIRPDIVYVAIPPFGEHGDLAGLDVDEWVVAAFAGVMAGQASDDGAPTFMLAPIAGTSTGLLTAAATAMALRHRERTGEGQQVLVSLLAGTMAVLAHDFVDSPTFKKDRWWHSHQRGPAPPFGLFEAGDGKWLALAVLNDKFWRNLCRLLGRDEWAEELTLDGVVRADPGTDRRQWLMPQLEAAMETRSLEEWLPLIAAADIPVGRVNSYAESLRDPQSEHNALALNIDDPVLGPTLQFGLPVRFSRSPGTLRGPLQRSVPASQWAWTARASRPGRSAKLEVGPPLAGLRVVDFGSYIAGTYIGLLLADMGADVLKIESLAGDSFRGTDIDFLSFNRGKRSASLDLRHDLCREAVIRLLASADVVIQNLRPGGIEKLGFDYETVRRTNPGVVYVSISAFGQEGPRRDEPGFDLLGQAFAGGPEAQGGDGEPLYHTAAQADYGASMLAFFGVTGALLERETSGLGQHIDTSLAEAAMLFGASRSMEVEGRTVGRRGAPRLRGLSPDYRLYSAADGWLFVDARHSGAGALQAALGTDAIEAAIASRSRTDVLGRLAAQGVIAVPVEPPWSVLRHPQLGANNLVSTLDDPVYGAATQGGVLLQFSRTPGVIQRGAPRLGEHTREILRLAGCDDGAIETAIHGGFARVV